MLQVALSLIKWFSLPVLLTASLFSQYAAKYEFLADSVICAGAILFSVQWAVRSSEYFWAAAFVGIAVLFSPLLLVVKIFLLLGLALIVTLAAILTAFQNQTRPMDSPNP